MIGVFFDKKKQKKQNIIAVVFIVIRFRDFENPSKDNELTVGPSHSMCDGAAVDRGHCSSGPWS